VSAWAEADDAVYLLGELDEERRQRVVELDPDDPRLNRLGRVDVWGPARQRYDWHDLPRRSMP
jgi:hypothetical protein